SAGLDPDAERELLAAHGRSFLGERYYAHPAYDHSGLYAGDQEILAGTATPPGGLAPLDALEGFRFARHDADPRRWPVVGEGDEPLGRVADLMVEVEARAPRYLVVRRASDGRAVLVPVGFALLDHAAGRVRLPGIVTEDLDALPEYPGGGIDRTHEDAVRASLLRRLLPDRRAVLPDFRDARG
ncbi:MAG: PRC-barrel domain-containing protein, partial [Longimicrobiales bacterium]